MSRTDYPKVAQTIRKEFEAGGKLPEMEQMWRNLEGCYVHKTKQANVLPTLLAS